MLVIDVILFGPIGLTIWAVQMVWIPLFAAGVINGVGHYWGFRSFQTDDASRNIVPWGILIGGEELHNNHHAYPTSARFSSKWWELDIGWFYIRILELLGLAKVKKRLPRVSLAAETSPCDERTLHAVIMTRYDILAKYSRSMKATFRPTSLSLFAAFTIADGIALSELHRQAPGNRVPQVPGRRRQDRAR